MPPNTQRTERTRRPEPVLSCGEFVDNQRWHRNDTSRELWDMAVLWSAAFGEPIEKSGS